MTHKAKQAGSLTANKQNNNNRQNTKDKRKSNFERSLEIIRGLQIGECAPPRLLTDNSRMQAIKNEADKPDSPGMGAREMIELREAIRTDFALRDNITRYVRENEEILGQLQPPLGIAQILAALTSMYGEIRNIASRCRVYELLPKIQDGGNDKKVTKIFEDMTGVPYSEAWTFPECTSPTFKQKFEEADAKNKDVELPVGLKKQPDTATSSSPAGAQDVKKTEHKARPLEERMQEPQPTVKKSSNHINDDELSLDGIFDEEEEYVMAGPSKAMDQMMEVMSELHKDHIVMDGPFGTYNKPKTNEDKENDQFDADIASWFGPDLITKTKPKLLYKSVPVSPAVKKALIGRKLVKTYVKDHPLLNDVVITTDETAVGQGIRVIIVDPIDVMDTLRQHPGAVVISENCGPCFDDTERKEAFSLFEEWYTSSPIPPMQGHIGCSVPIFGATKKKILQEMIDAKLNDDKEAVIALMIKSNAKWECCSNMDGEQWSFGIGTFDNNTDPLVVSSKNKLSLIEHKRGLMFKYDGKAKIPKMEHYVGFTRIPFHYDGSFMENVFTDKSYFYAPTKMINKLALRTNSTSDVMSQPAMHRQVAEAVKTLSWITEGLLDTEFLSSRVQTSIARHLWAINETLRNNEEPEWLRAGGLSQHVIKRVLRYLTPKIFGGKSLRNRKGSKWTSGVYVTPPLTTDGRLIKYGIMSDTPVGDNKAVEIRKERVEIPNDAAVNGELNRGDYATTLWKHANFSHSISNAKASLVNTYHLRATKAQPKVNVDAVAVKEWDDAREYVRRLYAPVRQEVFNVMDELAVTPMDVIDIDGHEYAPSVCILQSQMSRQMAGPSSGHMITVHGKSQLFNLSKGFLSWYSHLDKRHQDVYGEVLMRLKDNDPDMSGVTIDRPANPENIKNKVFVKVEVAVRSVAKTFRPRLIQYMMPQYAIHVAPMAWACYQTWQKYCQNSDCPMTFTGGLVASDVENRVLKFLDRNHRIKAGDDMPISMANDVLMFAGGDDNLCFLSDRLDINKFEERYSVVGRDPDVVKHDSLYSACYCSMGFFRWYEDGKGFTPRLMPLPFKQLEKLGYLKLKPQTSSKMARGENVDSDLIEALAAKAISFYYTFVGCPFMEPIAVELLRKCKVDINPNWTIQQSRAYVDKTSDDWYAKHYRVDVVRDLCRSPQSDASMWESYQFRYGVDKSALSRLQQGLIEVIRMDGVNLATITDETYDKCLGIDLGRDGRHQASPDWAPEGQIQCIEVDCGSYDASTNSITHNTNMDIQRFLFGSHYFIDALDSRRKAKLMGSNDFQELQAVARFQMLSGHADTTFGNTVSNITEMTMSLFHSYPELNQLRDDKSRPSSNASRQTSLPWFEEACEMTEGENHLSTDENKSQARADLRDDEPAWQDLTWRG